MCSLGKTLNQMYKLVLFEEWKTSADVYIPTAYTGENNQKSDAHGRKVHPVSKIFLNVYGVVLHSKRAHVTRNLFR